MSQCWLLKSKIKNDTVSFLKQYTPGSHHEKPTLQSPDKKQSEKKEILHQSVLTLDQKYDVERYCYKEEQIVEQPV